MQELKLSSTTNLVDLVISSKEVYDNAVSINTNDQTQFLNNIKHFVHKRIEIPYNNTLGTSKNPAFGCKTEEPNFIIGRNGGRFYDFTYPQKTGYEWADNQFISIKPTGLVVTQPVSTTVRKSRK